MDFFELLIILLFIVLPLLQQMLGKREEPGTTDGLPEDDDAERLPGMDREGATRPSTPAGPAARTGGTGDGTVASGGWAADWGEWPDEETEREEAEGMSIEALERPEVVEVPPTDAAVRDTSGRPATPYSYDDPARARAASRVVSLEKLHVDRAAEHARFHTRPERPTAGVGRRPPRIAALLEDPDELRRAILLAEVVGPPAALRGPPGPPGIA